MTTRLLDTKQHGLLSLSTIDDCLPNGIFWIRIEVFTCTISLLPSGKTKSSKTSFTTYFLFVVFDMFAHDFSTENWVSSEKSSVSSGMTTCIIPLFLCRPEDSNVNLKNHQQYPSIDKGWLKLWVCWCSHHKNVPKFSCNTSSFIIAQFSRQQPQNCKAVIGQKDRTNCDHSFSTLDQFICLFQKFALSTHVTVKFFAEKAARRQSVD